MFVNPDLVPPPALRIMRDLRNSFVRSFAAVALAGFTFIASAAATTTASRQQPVLQSQKNPDDSTGIRIEGQGMASASQSFPLQVEVWDKNADSYTPLRAAYRSFESKNGKWIGRGVIKGLHDLRFTFEDEWSVEGSALRLNRSVKVHGNLDGGFRSSVTLEITEPKKWPEVEWFSPGMIYGNFAHLRNNSFGAGNYYQPRNYAVWIREDRMPAPLMSARFADGSTLSVLNSAPNGATTHSEGNDFSHASRADARFLFGAIGAQENEKTLQLGFLFPGSEGQINYGRKSSEHATAHAAWRRRYHPIKDGFAHSYEVSFRFNQADNFTAFVSDSWRWAWTTLKPKANPQNLGAVWRHVVDMIAENTLEFDDRAGTQIISPAIPGQKEREITKSIMGFIGYALGSAEMMLAASTLDHTERGTELRRKAEKSIDSFLRIPMAPPAGEGFFHKSGEYATSQGGYKTDHELFLRCFTDDMKSLMRAYEDEQRAGRTHADWIAWVRQFADWLLTQEKPGGGFIRSWMPRTAKVVSDSPTGSFMAVPFYAQLHRITGEKNYLDVAIRTADFAWNQGQNVGRFVGGTIDNPDVIDKEAATISLEGYLALHDITKDDRWLGRAKAAAAMAETWMYIWNVPMPDDSPAAKLQWKRGVPTTGMQLIATGHSLIDGYMAFDVASFAKLYRLTGDRHYLEVATILLHNTKAMIELPGKPLGLRGPGWQQEHYCFSLPRGIGRHQFWLPWVSVSQLRGMKDLITQDPELYHELAALNGTKIPVAPAAP
ncbi:hypothetical protein [Nibricoccus aquaticus]|nr:hypothetical protein [Nibricoccus aquaticus]